MPDYESLNTHQIEKFGVLKQLLARFARGQHEPLIIAGPAGPAAAVVPLADYERLVDYDNNARADERAFRDETRRRIEEPGPSTRVDSVAALARSLGPAGAAWADENPQA